MTSHQNDKHQDELSPLTLVRLSLYLRHAMLLENRGKTTVSSKELARRFSISAALVRKDLGLLGGFGRRGVGYEIDVLKRGIRTGLGLTRTWRVAIVGAGRIGVALYKHKAPEQSGFEVIAIFDKFPQRSVGVRDEDLEVLPMAALPETVTQRSVDIGIIAVPGKSAQEAADKLVEAGLRAILNFAPAHISVPEHVFVSNLDYTIYLEGLAHRLNRELNLTDPS